MFDEEFIFEVSPEELDTLTLELFLYDYDEFSRHEGIGQVKVPLEDIDFEQQQIYWKPLREPEQLKYSEVSMAHYSNKATTMQKYVISQKEKKQI